MIKDLIDYLSKQPSYSEGSACATPTAMPTITTTQSGCDGQWAPIHTYDDCGIPMDDEYPARFMQQPPERPRHEDMTPIYRWQSNVKGTDFWMKINDAAGDDCIHGDINALIGAGRMMVSIHMSQCHSDEDLLKIFGAHPRRGST